MTINKGYRQRENLPQDAPLAHRGNEAAVHSWHTGYRHTLTVAFSRFITTTAQVIIGLLGLRFVISLLGADRGNVIYRLSEPVITPFKGMTAPASRFEYIALVGILFYGLLAWVVVASVDANGRACDD